MRRGLPLAYPGMKIGLFGGSFDPAHQGHAHVAETALKRLGLNRLWWLVTPQNPLKLKSASLPDRIASAKRVARGRKMLVTDLETQLGCRYTFETLRALKRMYPGVRFIFVMGADNLETFRRWRNWREMARSARVAVISRPRVSPRARVNFPKDWKYLTARLHRENSAELRASGASAMAKPPPG